MAANRHPWPYLWYNISSVRSEIPSETCSCVDIVSAQQTFELMRARLKETDFDSRVSGWMVQAKEEGGREECEGEMYSCIYNSTNCSSCPHYLLTPLLCTQLQDCLSSLLPSLPSSLFSPECARIFYVLPIYIMQSPSLILMVPFMEAFLKLDVNSRNVIGE